MERERLTRLVQEAASVGRDDLSELEALANRFPWFAGAQVLRTVGEHNVGEVRSEEVLRTAAAHVASRTRLFDQVHHTPGQRLAVVPNVVDTPSSEKRKTTWAETGTIPGPESTHAPAVGVGQRPDSPSVQVSDRTLPILEPEREEDFGAPMPPPSSASETPVSLDAVVEIETLSAAVPEPESASAERELDEDPLERQIMESALSHAYDIGWLELERSKARPMACKPEPVELPTPRPVVPIAPIQPAGPARSVTRYDRLSFTEWLSTTTEYPPQPQPHLVPAEREVPASAADWLERPAAPPPSEATSSTPPSIPAKKGELDTKSLIDNFIRQQTPLPAARTGSEPQKATFFTPQQAAKRSLDDKVGLVTETLARVYAQQGNVPKAIEAYKRLALKYPEKSAYFAALQKELEAQLNK